MICGVAAADLRGVFHRLQLLGGVSPGRLKEPESQIRRHDVAGDQRLGMQPRQQSADLSQIGQADDLASAFQGEPAREHGETA